jgi:hypothetical protein
MMEIGIITITHGEVLELLHENGYPEATRADAEKMIPFLNDKAEYVVTDVIINHILNHGMSTEEY